MAAKSLATALQKENFKVSFAEIVKNNETLNNNYSIQFFDSPAKSNYVINDLKGKSINVVQSLSLDELDKYRVLKSHWQD